ncbi:MAG: type II toxin-antitoxin system VapC family toxin [Candidatus Undinarchaeales archaeon]|jgi:predicted nucleic acid-binding protein|nr:type II toxin-antitoxin system VapC family toxin [Candidatus Undinarchaeales archaeon]
MKYLDSNIFLLPILYKGEKAKKAKKVLREMASGKIQCATSSLTVDEILWVLIKMKKDRERAIETCMDILELPNLVILDVTNEDVLRALEYMKNYVQLKPRDAIHIAVSTNAGIFTVVSDDTDFDGVQEINREKLD